MRPKLGGVDSFIMQVSILFFSGIIFFSSLSFLTEQIVYAAPSPTAAASLTQMFKSFFQRTRVPIQRENSGLSSNLIQTVFPLMTMTLSTLDEIMRPKTIPSHLELVPRTEFRNFPPPFLQEVIRTFQNTEFAQSRGPINLSPPLNGFLLVKMKENQSFLPSSTLKPPPRQILIQFKPEVSQKITYAINKPFLKQYQIYPLTSLLPLENQILNLEKLPAIIWAQYWGTFTPNDISKIYLNEKDYNDSESLQNLINLVQSSFDIEVSLVTELTQDPPPSSFRASTQSNVAREQYDLFDDSEGQSEFQIYLKQLANGDVSIERRFEILTYFDQIGLSDPKLRDEITLAFSSGFQYETFSKPKHELLFQSLQALILPESSLLILEAVAKTIDTSLTVEQNLALFIRLADLAFPDVQSHENLLKFAYYSVQHSLYFFSKNAIHGLDGSKSSVVYLEADRHLRERQQALRQNILPSLLTPKNTPASVSIGSQYKRKLAAFALRYLHNPSDQLTYDLAWISEFENDPHYENLFIAGESLALSMIENQLSREYSPELEIKTTEQIFTLFNDRQIELQVGVFKAIIQHCNKPDAKTLFQRLLNSLEKDQSQTQRYFDAIQFLVNDIDPELRVSLLHSFQ